MNFDNMTDQQIFDYFKSIDSDISRTITDCWNQKDKNVFSSTRRKQYADYLSTIPTPSKRMPNKTALDDLTNLLRAQAVQDFWDAERILVKQGKGTRNWTIEQQRAILNIKNGRELTHAGIPKENGVAFQGHHIFDVHDYPTA